jgi:hypothetical protein
MSESEFTEYIPIFGIIPSIFRFTVNMVGCCGGIPGTTPVQPYCHGMSESCLNIITVGFYQCIKHSLKECDKKNCYYRRDDDNNTKECKCCCCFECDNKKIVTSIEHVPIIPDIHLSSAPPISKMQEII